MIESRSLFRAIQRACSQELWGVLHRQSRWRSNPAVGQCADCGTTKYLVRDHRSYNEPFQYEIVCTRCNFLRGPAEALLIDVETLEVHNVGHKWRRPGGRRKATRS